MKHTHMHAVRLLLLNRIGNSRLMVTRTLQLVSVTIDIPPRQLKEWLPCFDHKCGNGEEDWLIPNKTFKLSNGAHWLVIRLRYIAEWQYTDSMVIRLRCIAEQQYTHALVIRLRYIYCPAAISDLIIFTRIIVSHPGQISSLYIMNQHTRESLSQLALKRYHTSTTTKTWVAYSNSHLACMYRRYISSTRGTCSILRNKILRKELGWNTLKVLKHFCCFSPNRLIFLLPLLAVPGKFCCDKELFAFYLEFSNKQSAGHLFTWLRLSDVSLPISFIFISPSPHQNLSVIYVSWTVMFDKLLFDKFCEIK